MALCAAVTMVAYHTIGCVTTNPIALMVRMNLIVVSK